MQSLAFCFMSPFKRHNIARLLYILLCCFIGLATIARAQDRQPTPDEQTDDVIRINTELVQTGVLVFDRAGRFVDGLQREQFELKVDGKPQPISFFDLIKTGSANEEAQLAAARGAVRVSQNNVAARPLDRGRTIIFFIDDLHLAVDSVNRIRKTLLHFIDDEMGQNDQAAIASTSGQIGFLQQFTDNKAVLRAAVARLNYRPYNVRDLDRPPMTEYQALLISRYDRDVLDYFVEQVLRDNPGLPRSAAEQMVQDRARPILQIATSITTNTLSTLQSLMQSSAKLPGRKLAFFISDGFFLDNRNSNATDRVRRITDAAARADVVIYSMDARGLVTGLPDASESVAFDPSGRLQRATGGEITASQDALNALAVDTGGRAIRNTNALDPGIRQALAETSTYYLLAWRPDPNAQRAGKFRNVEVSVKGRADLKVRVQRGFFEPSNQTTAKSNRSATPIKPPPVKIPVEELRTAIGALYPASALPTLLSASYADISKNGTVLTVSMQIASRAAEFNTVNGKQSAAIDVVGVILNDQGKQQVGFKERLNITAAATDTAQPQYPDLFYNFQSHLKPGLYQVRVAARDEKSGRLGSATEWIEIPDLASRRLALSSLLVGERTATVQNSNNTAATDGVQISIARRFARTSYLRFLVVIYNASRGTNDTTTPDVALQVQVFRDNQPIVTSPLKKVSTEDQDAARIAYAAELSLEAMPAGRYVLQVTAIDRISKTSASQRTNFTIE